jgi:Flp pilus assembly protein TadG
VWPDKGLRKSGEAMLLTQVHILNFVAQGTGSPLRRLEKQRGAALVEYAFILTAFLTLLFGIGAFGHALYAYHFVNNAAKQATRWASVNGSTCNSDNSCNGVGTMNNGPVTSANLTTYVRNIAPSGINPAAITVTACGVSGGTACAASTPEVCTTAIGSGVDALPATPNYPGCTVQVNVQYTFTLIFPLIGAAPITLSSTSDMIIVH